MKFFNYYSPDVLKFLNKTVIYLKSIRSFIFETLSNFKKNCSNDVLHLSHGVHRGKLKVRSSDDREKFIKNLDINVKM